MSKVKVGLRGLTVPELIERGRLVTRSMSGNLNFPLPIPALSEVNSGIDDLEIAYIDSRGRDKDKVALMRVRKKRVVFLLNQLAAYVQVASVGDEGRILSSGFDVVGGSNPRPDTAGIVTALRLFDGSVPAKVRATWKAAANAVLYLVEVSHQADFSGAVIRAYTSRTQKEVGEFVSGTRIWIRVTGLGRETPGDTSEPVSFLVRG